MQHGADAEGAGRREPREAEERESRPRRVAEREEFDQKQVDMPAEQQKLMMWLRDRGVGTGESRRRRIPKMDEFGSLSWKREPSSLLPFKRDRDERRRSNPEGIFNGPSTRRKLRPTLIANLLMEQLRGNRKLRKG